MNNEIVTSNGIYKYTNIKLFYGRKIIDLKTSKNNLLDFKRLLDSKGVHFGIIYGTLLGAVREKNFIKYDEDIDVFILNENREKFLSLLFELRIIGFEVVRYESDLLSIMRNDDYIDVYFFKKNILGRWGCNGDSLEGRYLNSNGKIWFLGEEFNTPGEYVKFLEKAYGKDWKIPKKNSPAEVKSIVTKSKNKFFVYSPKIFIYLLKKIRNFLRKKFTANQT